MITLIAAMDEIRVIGRGDELPWQLPGDLKHFRETTMDHVVIMGRKTWQSIAARFPDRPYLEGRVNYVVTHAPDRWAAEVVGKTDKIFGPHFVTTLELAVSTARRQSPDFPEDLFLIGGESMFDLALRRNLADRMIISHVEGKHDGDVLFPKFGPVWKVGQPEKHEGFEVIEYTKE